MSEKRKFISWRRVSTWKQSRSGLGLDAQEVIINGYINIEHGELIADYAETYTGKELSNCTELKKAIDHAKREGATLIIAKTDRFRNTEEALHIYNDMAGQIYFCDCPTQDKFTITIMFALAEREALTTSIRTKAALAAKKLRDGSWADSYGKHTGTTRADALEVARAKAAFNARTKALANTNNEEFARYISVWEDEHGRIDRTTDVAAIVDHLNALGYKTATGLSFNIQRFRNMLYKTRLFMIS